MTFFCGQLWSSEPMARFDHEKHEEKVFTKEKISCNYCHNIEMGPDGKSAVITKALEKSTFVKPLGQLCHSCHQNNDTKYPSAPQTCYSCHRSLENFQSIKPQNHSIVNWVRNHALNAKSAGDSCQTCHTNSQCVKCHVERNQVKLSNHTRNFKFYHSIEARMQPQRCDTCHTKNFCTTCHLRGR